MGPERDNNFSERLGKAIAKGLVRGVCGVVALTLTAVLVVSGIRNMLGRGLDDSDKGAWERSGLTVRTDALTGRQYLETSAGHLVPRLGANGMQIVVEVRK